jgi:hypothetical protein
MPGLLSCEECKFTTANLNLSEEQLGSSIQLVILLATNIATTLRTAPSSKNNSGSVSGD